MFLAYLLLVFYIAIASSLRQAIGAYMQKIRSQVMKLNSLKDLFLEEVRDLYDAEKQLVKALPKMADAATSPKLKSAFTNHLRQTEGHVKRLEQIFHAMDVPVRGKKCKAMQGLIDEGNDMAHENAEPDVKDAALIAAGNRVEHYEIAGYGTIRTYARTLGLPEAERLLQQTLDEEGEADKLLTSLGETSTNLEAATAPSKR